MAKMNGEENVCNYCGGGHGEHGCSGRYGGKYFLVKCILVILALIIVFSAGFKLGIIVGYIHGGFEGNGGNRSMMYENGYQYNTPMMNGQYGQQIPQSY